MRAARPGRAVRRSACARRRRRGGSRRPRSSSNSSSDWNERRMPARARRAGLHDRPVIADAVEAATRPSLGLVKPVTRVDERGLAGAVRADEPDHLARLDAEAHAVDRDDGAEPHGEVLDLERGRAHRRSAAASTSCSRRRRAPESKAQLADAPLVVEHDARDAVRVQDHDEDQRDAAEGDEPRAEIDPVERDRSRGRLRPSRFPPNTAPSTQPTPPATALPTVLIDWNGA